MSDTPPPPSPAAAAPTPTPSRTALDEYYQTWEQKVAGMKQASAVVDWSRADWSKLKPSDIGVQIGPVMTEEQFREYRRRTGSTPHVLKAPAPTNTPTKK